MPTLQTLKTNLPQRLEGAARIGILGIGSELRADDVAGILVAQRLQELLGVPRLRGLNPAEGGTPNVAVFLGGTAPENLTGEIKRFHPTHLVIIDAADLDSEPGAITLMDPDSIGGTTFCTHSLPLKVMIDYLLNSFPCHVTIIGIQPKTLEVGAPVSKEVLDAVKSLAVMLLDAMPQT
jgi:hydrogenase 3 maturation protease